MGVAPADIEARHQLAERAEEYHRADNAGLPRLPRLGVQRREKVKPLRLHRRDGRQHAAHTGRGVLLVPDEGHHEVYVKEAAVLRELLNERRFDRDAALHVHHAAPVEDVSAGPEYFREPVGSKGVFGDIAVAFYIDDVVMADEQHRARRLFGGVDAGDQRFQLIKRALQRRFGQLKVSSMFLEIGKL